MAYSDTISSWFLAQCLMLLWFGTKMLPSNLMYLEADCIMNWWIYLLISLVAVDFVGREVLLEVFSQ